MHKLEKLILESISEVDKDRENTIRLSDLAPSFRKSLEDRYGKSKYPEYDFLSSDMDTYFFTTDKNKETGATGHKVINLPSFENLYTNFSDIIGDMKKLMNSKDIRTDKSARELFELIKTNFRKLQRYLRTERPDQYELMKMRRSMEEAILSLNEYSNLLNEEDTQKPEPVLEDATDKILSKFPTLKAILIKLQTEDFKEFVDTIDWISPRPTSFRVNLANGQDYILKWTGKGFEAQIMGKRYYLDKIDEYQQALDKLTVLYQQGPMGSSSEEPAEPADTGSGSSGGGGGDFPGVEGGVDSGDDALGGDDTVDAGGEEGGADLTDEPVDFEEPEEEPEA